MRLIAHYGPSQYFLCSTLRPQVKELCATLSPLPMLPLALMTPEPVSNPPYNPPPALFGWILKDDHVSTLYGDLFSTSYESKNRSSRAVDIIDHIMRAHKIKLASNFNPTRMLQVVYGLDHSRESATSGEENHCLAVCIRDNSTVSRPEDALDWSEDIETIMEHFQFGEAPGWDPSGASKCTLRSASY